VLEAAVAKCGITVMLLMVGKGGKRLKANCHYMHLSISMQKLVNRS